MRRMSLLPKEFGGTQEQARAHFPPHNIRPLIDQQRKIAMAFDPAGKRVTNDGFRCRPHDQRLFKPRIRIRHQTSAGHFQSVMGDNRHLLGKAFDMLGFPGDERERNEQREIAVVVSCLFDAPVQFPLNLFPNSIAPRFDDHGATNRRAFRQLRVPNHGLVPLREVRLSIRFARSG